MKNLFLFLLFFASTPLFADIEKDIDKIEVPTEELETESVLPVFDKSEVIKVRNINTALRIEFGPSAGMSLNEPFYNPLVFGGVAAFNFNEVHGLNIQYLKFGDGLNSYGKQLKRGEGLNNSTFDAGLAPHQESFTSLNYQYAAYYGKISITKFYIMNLTVYGMLGAGMVNDGEKSRPAINIGIGQKLYFSKYIALRIDLDVYSYKGVDPASVDLQANGIPKSSDQFAERNYFIPAIVGSLVFML